MRAWRRERGQDALAPRARPNGKGALVDCVRRGDACVARARAMLGWARGTLTLAEMGGGSGLKEGGIDATKRIVARAEEDGEFRRRLLAGPEAARAAVEQELGVSLAERHRLVVHEETDAETHLVLAPRSRRSAEDRAAARTGAASLEFLKKTMHDPAPPRRAVAPKPGGDRTRLPSPSALGEEARQGIRRGLAFLESAIDDNGAWHCIRFNLADSSIPRHYERPAFISALCTLALESCDEPRAKALRAATWNYIAATMEHPGFWRYYRHLPQDLDSSALCGLVIGTHPWIALGRNVARMLANRDADGRFMTWVLEQDEPDVMPSFRIEADPVVNANVIAYLRDRAETRAAQRWLHTLIADDRIAGTSKWYPSTVAIYYAITRAVVRTSPALDHLRPLLAERILGLATEAGEFGNVLETAQAMSALHNVGSLGSVDAVRETARLLDSQRDDGSWPELLAFGDETLRWGLIGQIGHGAESVTTAFCIEALERLTQAL